MTSRALCPDLEAQPCHNVCELRNSGRSAYPCALRTAWAVLHKSNVEGFHYRNPENIKIVHI